MVVRLYSNVMSARCMLFFFATVKMDNSLPRAAVILGAMY